MYEAYCVHGVMASRKWLDQPTYTHTHSTLTRFSSVQFSVAQHFALNIIWHNNNYTIDRHLALCYYMNYDMVCVGTYKPIASLHRISYFDCNWRFYIRGSGPYVRLHSKIIQRIIFAACLMIFGRFMFIRIKKNYWLPRTSERIPFHSISLQPSTNRMNSK